MEQERIALENEEKERAERMKKIKEQFTDPNSQWEKDKTDIQNMAMEEKTKEQAAAGEESKDATGSSDQVREAAAAVNAAR
jgi:mannan polymerase II complex ANP1 subunit